MPSAERERVLSVKRGEVAQSAVLEEIAKIQQSIEDLLDVGLSPLPDEPAWEVINAWSASAHRRHRGW